MSERYYRKIIRITATDSPNVALAMEQARRGLAPTGEVIIPGVLPWADYVKRRQTWDPIQQSIGLDAQFYEGAEVLLFPPQWLDHAHRLADSLVGRARQARAVGVDPAEGGDKTSMSAVDEWGLVERVSKRTPDTSVITGEAVAFFRRHGVPAERVLFDLGGGGKEHVDRLRQQGHMVRGVAFGESPTREIQRGVVKLEDKRDQREDRVAYVNRRAEMYGELRLLMDPSLERPGGVRGFALPRDCQDVRAQLAPIPLLYDAEGRLRLPPKNRRSATGTERTLVELIGHSPDEADSLVLAVHALLHGASRRSAGAL